MQVRIYQPIKSATQSVQNKNYWLLEFICTNRFIDNLGRTSSNDMFNSEVKMKFATLELAINFAKTHNYEFEVIVNQKPKIKPKNYADNFKPNVM